MPKLSTIFTNGNPEVLSYGRVHSFVCLIFTLVCVSFVLMKAAPNWPWEGIAKLIEYLTWLGLAGYGMTKATEILAAFGKGKPQEPPRATE